MIGAGEYVREVEARFLELEGRGFALSAQDVGRVLAWHTDGVPIQLALAALDEANHRRIREGWSKLNWSVAEKFVDAAMERAGRRGVLRMAEPVSTRGYSDLWAVVLDTFEQLVAKSSEPIRTAVCRARERFEGAKAAGADVWRATAEADTELVRTLSGYLSRCELKSIDDAVQARTRDLARTADEDTLSETRMFLTSAEVRRRAGVPELRGLLIGAVR